MSGTLPANPPVPVDGDESAVVELLLEARARDVGGFTVRRVLPSAGRRMVGPFTFFDHMDATLAPGVGFDVRPHPHICLATVTFLFEGEIVHRDSLGYLQPIRPGDLNWMTAGCGIVHSERSSPERRASGQVVKGIQCWVALPLDEEEREPSFEHHPAASLPVVRREGVALEVIAGTAYGERSPARVLSPTLYVHARLEAGAALPVDDEHRERAIYVVEGTIRCDGRLFQPGTMVVLRPGATAVMEASSSARVMLLGGATLTGERHIWWNFVASSSERIERAKDDWRQRRFPPIPGDDQEFIPLPES
jgi:redox-sensitive bicupin YhaK (pirin superfamily)